MYTITLKDNGKQIFKASDSAIRIVESRLLNFTEQKYVQRGNK